METTGTKMGTTKLAIDMVVAAVFDTFMATGRDSTVADIANALEVSESSVRRLLSKNTSWIGPLRYSEERRESFEKNYGTARGSHKVGLYCVSRNYLRDKLARASEGR